MRFVTFLLILALIGGAAYVAIFHWDDVQNLFAKGKRVVEGYKPAKTPSAAMDQFIKAIDKRDYETASLYCTGEYAEHLKKAHEAANAVGSKVDSVWAFVKEKGLHTDKVEVLLLRLDPFPKKFRVNDVKKDEKSGKTFGTFHADLGDAWRTAGLVQELSRMDPKVMQSVLLPPQMWMPPNAVQLVEEGEGEQRQWKLNFPLPPVQRDCINHFINVHKSYVTALNSLIHSLRQDRYASKNAFERDLISTLQEAK
jgi:hypothetical protein